MVVLGKGDLRTLEMACWSCPCELMGPEWGGWGQGGGAGAGGARAGVGGRGWGGGVPTLPMHCGIGPPLWTDTQSENITFARFAQWAVKM